LRSTVSSSIAGWIWTLPEAELHVLDGGHWALETNLDEIVALMRDFLGRRSLGA
jgi:surfactin synthase thioesterase subunit